MTKQNLIDNNFEHIATDSNQTELWTRYMGTEDMIRYVFYFPQVDNTGEDRIISYHSLIEPYAIMKDFFADKMQSITTWEKI